MKLNFIHKFLQSDADSAVIYLLLCTSGVGPGYSSALYPMDKPLDAAKVNLRSEFWNLTRQYDHSPNTDRQKR